MATLTEDDVLEQLEAQDNLFSFMKTAHTILLQGIRQFLPSLFVNNDEEIVEYAVKPLLAQSGPLDDIDVALRLIYALGKMDKWLYADITHFSQFWHYPCRFFKLIYTKFSLSMPAISVCAAPTRAI